MEWLLDGYIEQKNLIMNLNINLKYNYIYQ